MTECLFCKIVAGTIPATLTFQSKDVIAFRDIHPKAPVHQLIIPTQHYATLNDITDPLLLGQLMTTAALLAKQEGVAEKGYRVVMNCHIEGGQEIYHVHLHLLAGRQLHWPPG